MPNRSVAVELKMLVANYVQGARQASAASKQTAGDVLALSKAETQLESAINSASQAVTKNGATLDRSTAKGRANQAALDQLAAATREYRQTLIAQGASQEAVAAATERGRTAWLSAASAMGVEEAQAKKLSATLFAASRTIRDHRAEAAALGTTLGIVGGVIALGVGKAVATYAAFDKEMSAVAATGDDARNSLDKLRAKALELGADSQYSATEAAAGVTELLKAGVKAEDVLGGGLAGALTLAASGEMEVADASQTLAITLAQFNLDGTQAVHVADLLAAGAGKASGNVSQLANALQYVGPVAAGMNISVEETVGVLAEFASKGILADQAGTSFRGVLMALTSPSRIAKTEMERLGITLYNSEGKFLGVANMADQLTKAYDGTGKITKKATDAQKDYSLGLIFGNEQVTAARTIIDGGASAVENWTKAVNDAGFAQRQAAALTNNLTGDIERLGGSIDTAFIQSGSGANAVLRQMAQGTESLVNLVGQLPAPLLSATTMIAGSGGLAVLGVAGMLKLGGSVADARANMVALGISAKTAKIAVVGVGAAIAVGTIALTAWAEAQAEARAGAEQFASTLVVVGGKVQRTDATLGLISEKLASGTVGWQGMGGTIAQVADQMGVSTQDMIDYLNDVPGAWDKVAEAQNRVRNGGLAGGGVPDVLGEKDLRGALDRIKNSLTEAQRTALAKAQADEAAGVGAKTYAEAQEKANATTERGTDALKAYSQALFDSATAALKASGSQIGWEAALDDTAAAIKKTGEAHRLANGELDLNTEKGRANQTALDQLATSSVAYTQTLIEQNASEEQIQAVMERSRQAFIKQATAAGMSTTAAAALADQYGLIPESVTTEISSNADYSKSSLDALAKALREMDGKHVKAYVDVEAAYVDKYNKSRTGGPKLADGGMLDLVTGRLVRQFASGGFGQPQVRPFQGSAGVNWGEEGSGPWEAFISGAPQKRTRSQAVYREVGRRLFGSSTSAAEALLNFADGGIAEPSADGHPLSWWQDYLKTDLELTRLQIAIRDLKADLAEKETVKVKGKKTKRLKLRGLDRTAAQQELGEDLTELDLSIKARALNASAEGTIADRIAKWEQAKTDADTALNDANDLTSAIQSWTAPFMAGSSFQGLLANLNAGSKQLATYNDLVGQLQSEGLSPTLTAWLTSQGVGGMSLARQILAGGDDAISLLNQASTNLDASAKALATTTQTGTYSPSPPIPTVWSPGIAQSGAVPAATLPDGLYGRHYQVTIPVTASDPYAVAVVVDQKLRDL